MADDIPLLRQPEFRRFWLSRLAGTAASQMLMVALGWQMYALTGSAWDLGLVGLAQFLPALLLALPAGHQVDHSDRRTVLAAALAVQVAVALALAGASAAGGLGRGALLAVSVLLGALRAYQMPASQALLPLLVPSAQWPRAMALSSSALQVAIIGGPALGGLAYAGGAALVYGLTAGGFAIALACVLGLAPRPPTQAAEPHNAASLLAGLRFIGSRPLLLGAVAAYGATMVVFGLSTSLWLSLPALAASGAADRVNVVIRQSLVQLATPDAMRGRVSAVNSVFIGASNQLGEFESGATAAWLGPVASVVWGGVGTGLVVLVWALLFPALARCDRLASPPAVKGAQA